MECEVECGWSVRWSVDGVWMECEMECEMECGWSVRWSVRRKER
jgi:hypothetical protein